MATPLLPLILFVAGTILNTRIAHVIQRTVVIEADDSLQGFEPALHGANALCAGPSPPRTWISTWSCDTDQASSSAQEYPQVPVGSNSITDIGTVEWKELEYRLFSTLETLQVNRLQVATYPGINEPVLMKLGRDSEDQLSLQREIGIYRRLQGTGITPAALGHIIEDGRVVGIVIQYLPQTVSGRRDLRPCMAALRKLHQEGIVHGDAHDGNCLLRQDRSAVLIDFELAREERSQTEFSRDVDVMARCILASQGFW